MPDKAYRSHFCVRNLGAATLFARGCDPACVVDGLRHDLLHASRPRTGGAKTGKNAPGSAEVADFAVLGLTSGRVG
jgi:hypothetical protein